ncbi:MAG: hypothetical protein ACK2U1_07905 [Anaerolineales bacterium]
MLNRSRSIRLIALLLGIVILASCTPNKELVITAKFLANDQTIECPPICVEVDDPPSGPDTSEPISIEVCPVGTDCFQLESGQSVKVSSDVTVRVPDGISPGQQLPTMEKDSYLKFMEWSDGNTDNPRTVEFSAGAADLTAYFAAWEPLTVSSDATDRGCGNDVGIWLGTSASWAPVTDQPQYQIVQGPVTSSHVSDADLYTVHKTNDVNMWILLPREEQFSLLSEKNGQLGNRPGQIEIEWESGSYPTWAWPSPEVLEPDEPPIPNIDDADIAWVKGTWIFDCGHQDSAIEQGAWTEIHPPIATAVMRGTREGRLFFKEYISTFYPELELHEEAKGIQAVQVDMWINGDGGEGAVKSVKCAKAFGDGAGCIFNPVFDITGVYEFDVPLPPAPSPLDPEAQFHIGFRRLQPGQPVPEITPTFFTEATDHLHVKLDLSNYKDAWSTCKQQNELPGENLVNCAGDAYGVTMIAGWEVFKYPTDLHLVRLTVNSIQIFDDMEGEGTDGEYKLWLDVGPSGALTGDAPGNGHVALHTINPALNDVAGNGESYSLTQNGNSLVFLFNVRENNPESNKISLTLDGYEEDLIWDDKLRKLVRVFHQGFVTFDGTPPGGALPSYGMETVFGTVRANTSSPIPYSDYVRRIPDACINCFTHSLDYTIEEVSLP